MGSAHAGPNFPSATRIVPSGCLPPSVTPQCFQIVYISAATALTAVPDVGVGPDRQLMPCAWAFSQPVPVIFAGRQRVQSEKHGSVDDGTRRDGLTACCRCLLLFRVIEVPSVRQDGLLHCARGRTCLARPVWLPTWPHPLSGSTLPGRAGWRGFEALLLMLAPV